MIDVDSRKTVRGINVLVILGERAMAAKIYGQLYIVVCMSRMPVCKRAVYTPVKNCEKKNLKIASGKLLNCHKAFSSCD